MPDNFRPMDKANPYADYSISQSYEFVSSFVPQHLSGLALLVFDTGFGSLGHALALRAGRSYEDLVVERGLRKLGLANTRITLTPEMRRGWCRGMTRLRRVSNWDLPTLAGAGALRSCAHDLVRFLDAAQGRVETSLTPAFGRLLEVRRQTDSANVVAAAGWFVTAEHSDELVWKDGGTGGYATFVGYSARSGVAAVLLSNSRSYYSATALGRHLVNPGFPAPVLHHPVTVDAATLARLAGRYPVLPSLTLTVFSRDGGLFVAQPGQGETEVFAESETRFFYREVNAQLTFEIGADGKATALVLHQNGRDRRAVRLPEWTPLHYGGFRLAAQAPADFGGDTLEEFGLVGLFGGRANHRVELVGVVADEDAPLVRLDAIEDDGCGGGGGGRGFLEEAAGAFGHEVADVVVGQGGRVGAGGGHAGAGRAISVPVMASVSLPAWILRELATIRCRYGRA